MLRWSGFHRNHWFSLVYCNSALERPHWASLEFSSRSIIRYTFRNGLPQVCILNATTEWNIQKNDSTKCIMILTACGNDWLFTMVYFGLEMIPPGGFGLSDVSLRIWSGFATLLYRKCYDKWNNQFVVISTEDDRVKNEKTKKNKESRKEKHQDESRWNHAQALSRWNDWSVFKPLNLFQLKTAEKYRHVMVP